MRIYFSRRRFYLHRVRPVGIDRVSFIPSGDQKARTECGQQEELHEQPAMPWQAYL